MNGGREINDSRDIKSISERDGAGYHKAARNIYEGDSDKMCRRKSNNAMNGARRGSDVRA
jgi:hypothetical protein